MVVRCLEHFTARVDRFGFVSPLRAHVQALQPLPRGLQVEEQLPLAAGARGARGGCCQRREQAAATGGGKAGGAAGPLRALWVGRQRSIGGHCQGHRMK